MPTVTGSQLVIVYIRTTYLNFVDVGLVNKAITVTIPPPPKNLNPDLPLVCARQMVIKALVSIQSF